MSLILATGSNIGDREANLNLAMKELKNIFQLTAKSQIYKSAAIEYEDQPEFFNQVLEFETPSINPHTAMKEILKIEKKLGRRRDIPKGPRTIDIDIVFWDLEQIKSRELTIPHPAWNQRSFVIEPLKELPYFQTIIKHFNIPSQINNTAQPI